MEKTIEELEAEILNFQNQISQDGPDIIFCLHEITARRNSIQKKKYSEFIRDPN